MKRNEVINMYRSSKMKIDKANEIVLVMNITDACCLLGVMDVPHG